MDVREKMIAFRKSMSASQKDMAHKSQCTVDLIDIVENGGVTHPLIARKIAKAYGLTVLEAEELMPTCHRPHHPDYDPNKYYIPPSITRGVAVK